MSELISGGGWDYLKIEGTPAERGIQHGKLLAGRIIECLEREKKLLYLQTGMNWDYFRDSALELWEKRLNEAPYKDYRIEMEGIAEGVRQVRGYAVSWKDILTWNAYEELSDYWFPNHAQEAYQSLGLKGSTGKSFGAGSPDRCSAFLAVGSYTADGRIVAAHNSFVPFEMAAPMNVIQDITTEDGVRVIMQSQPGMIHSMSDFYISSNGLIVTETTIGGFCAYNDDGAPEFVRIRRAVQEAKSLDDFCDIFWRDNTGGYANTWLVGDISNNRIMQFETGCKFFNRQELDDGFFVGFNAPQDVRIRNFECSNTGFADIRRHQGARQVRLPQLMEKYKGQINETVAQNILADHYDVYLNKEDNPCSRTVCSHYELDAREYMSQPGRPVPYRPQGAVDGKVTTSAMAEKLQLSARYGSSCGMEFNAEKFFAEHKQFDYLREFIESRPSQPWTSFPM